MSSSRHTLDAERAPLPSAVAPLGQWLKRYPLVGYFLESLLYVLGYKCFGNFSMLFVIPGTASTPIWLGAGFALAVLLLRGPRMIPALFVSIAVAEIDFFSNVIIPQSTHSSLLQHLLMWFLLTSGITLNIAAGYFAVTLLLKTHNPFREMRHIVAYVGITALTFLIGATLALPIVLIEGAVEKAGIFLLWRNWWLSDYGSSLVLTPLLVVLFYERGRAVGQHALLKITLFVMAYLACVYVVFFAPATHHLPMIWLLYSALIGAAILFGESGAVVVGFSSSLIALWATVQGLGPFTLFPADYVLLIEQFFVSFFMISALVVAAILSEKQKTLDELRVANALAQSASQQALESSRVKSEFLANMSHEIRTPLNAVMGFTELLARTITDKQQLSYLQAIKSGGQSLLTLINDILDLSKIEAGKLDLQYEPVALHELLEEMIRIFSAKADEKKLKLVLDIDPQLPHFLILDEIRLRQILFNLMGNALKFTDKGQVKLSASSILNEADDSKVDMVISVADTGVGIPDSALKSIFEAFTQQDKQDTRKYGGTGLGLSISRKLVSMMDGTIEVESSFGEGATFSVYFTGVSISASEGKNRLKNAELEKIKFAPAKVLVVDDIEVNRELISEIFSNQPFEIIQAENGQEAVRMAHEHHPQLVITDIRMPVMDGFEELRQLREAPDTQHIPVVALTASVMEHEIYKLEESGFNGYLRKPARLDNIYKELMKVLPYQLEQSVAPEALPEDADAPDLSSLPLLLETLGGELSDIQRVLLKNQKMNLLEKFGASLEALCSQHPFGPLRAYCEAFHASLNSFDSDEIDGVLQGYPTLLTQLSSLQKDIPPHE
ncbi:MAG: ATP-binding protein [Candidatus Sericytochromatia bacterium]